MLSQLTIAKAATEDPALDYRQLYSIGLQYIQNLSGQIWTDYNVHDPGVTILELRCSALTDLSYRGSYSIEDILAGSSGTIDPTNQTLFTAPQILPNRALTLPDYRKLLIDIPHVQNAWLQPFDLTCFADPTTGTVYWTDPSLPHIQKVPIFGLFSVLIEFADNVTGVQKDAIKKNIDTTLLPANRNLCQDFIPCLEVTSQSFLLCCEVELAPDADTTMVLAQIQFLVQQYFAPPVYRYSLSQMLARTKADGTPYTIDEIFDGPNLQHGFIDDDQLAKAEMRTVLYLSEIIAVIMDIPGVLAIRDIVVNPEGTTAPLADKWIVPVQSGKKAMLDLVTSRVLFYKKNMPVVADAKQTKADLAQLQRAANANTANPWDYDLSIPSGTYRNPQSYYSFQNHFPAVYGIGDAGLSSNADATRQAQASQLQGYLLFFDQLMANYLAQLASVKQVFSTDPTVTWTYFSQMVDSLNGYDKIYLPPNPATTLATIIEDPTSASLRRNRFLDHLISRFAEQFTDFANVMYSAFKLAPGGMAALKCDFLNLYPTISSERSLAYNHTLQDPSDLWNSSNVSGLEKRLAKLLGLPNYNRRNLYNNSYDNYAAVQPSGAQFTFAILDRNTNPYQPLLSSAVSYATAALAQADLTRTIFFALLPAGYQKTTGASGTYMFRIIADKQTVLANHNDQYPTEAARDDAINQLIRYLQQYYDDSGMYLVESILLRSNPPGDATLHFCADPNCIGCPDEDPYSYRIHIILPAYSSRFSNFDFRKYAEDVIRAETPAHILPKICWIRQDQMAAFEKVYSDWLYAKSGAVADPTGAKLQALITELYQLNNVYPPQALASCAEPTPKFILNRNSLGSLKSEGQQERT